MIERPGNSGQAYSVQAAHPALAARVVVVVVTVLLRLIRWLEERSVLLVLKLGQPRSLDLLLQQLDPIET